MVCNYKLRSVWLSLPLRRMNYASPINRILSYVNGLALGCAAKLFTCPQSVRRYITGVELLVFGLFLYGCAILEKNYAVSHLIIIYSMPVLISLCYVEGGWITRFIAASKVSKASPYVYAFYMSHFLFILLAYTICNKVLGIWGNMSMMQVQFMVVATFVSACMASILLHHYVEKRMA